MKLLPLLLAVSLLTVAAPVSAVLADDSCSACSSCCADKTVDFTITPAGANKAKVTSPKKTMVVPIKFTDGASWDSVKHSYSLPAGTCASLCKKGFSISIDVDGKATFTPKK